MYKFRNIEKIGFEELAHTWNLAFSDYILPMSMTPESIEAYFKVSGVERSQSFSAFYEDALVGLLVNSVDTFRGKVVAYDAMTGIVPEHRGKGLFSQLFQYTKNSLKNNDITHYYLEVITTNENAYSIYKKKGGKVDREFSFLEGKMNSNLYSSAKVKVSPLSAFPKEELSKYEPSFGNRIAALHRNIKDYQIAYVQAENKKSAAAVFNRQGKISQIMWDGTDSSDLLYAVITHLSQNFDKLSISNIPIAETELISELLNIGFKILVNQYEMCIEL